MATLYLDRKNLELRSAGKACLIYEEGRKVDSLPISLLDRLVLRGGVVTNSSTLGLLADEGVAVNMLTGRFGRRQATLVGPLHKDVTRRLAQYRAWHDPAIKRRLASMIVRHKLISQIRFINRALSRRPDQRYLLTRTRTAIQDLLPKLTDTKHIGSLRGYEGAASAAYFGAFAALFADSLGFGARRRRPPPDPVNALLSLGYTLLHAEAVQACHQAGLDPYLGFLHDPDYGRESLAADLIEPLRARVDALVWALFRERQLKPAHFSSSGGACLLNKTGRALFYPAYELQAGFQRTWMRRTLYMAVNTFKSSEWTDS